MEKIEFFLENLVGISIAILIAVIMCMGLLAWIYFNYYTKGSK